MPASSGICDTGLDSAGFAGDGVTESRTFICDLAPGVTITGGKGPLDVACHLSRVTQKGSDVRLNQIALFQVFMLSFPLKSFLYTSRLSAYRSGSSIAYPRAMGVEILLHCSSDGEQLNDNVRIPDG